MKRLRNNRQTIAKIISERCNKDVSDVEADMLEVKTLNSTEAVEYGLVHEIKIELIPKDADVILIA